MALTKNEKKLGPLTKKPKKKLTMKERQPIRFGKGIFDGPSNQPDRMFRKQRKKSAVSGTKVNTNKGKMSANDKVGPSHLGRSNPQKKKSTADKTSVVNKATTGQQSEKTAPNMSRSTKKIGSVAKGNETYNKGPAMLKSKEDKKKSAARLKAGKKTVKAKPRYRARATMTGFGR